MCRTVEKGCNVTLKEIFETIDQYPWTAILTLFAVLLLIEAERGKV